MFKSGLDWTNRVQSDVFLKDYVLQIWWLKFYSILTISAAANTYTNEDPLKKYSVCFPLDLEIF